MSWRSWPSRSETSSNIGDSSESTARSGLHLLLSDRPLDASDLISRLGISKALASMSLKELLYYQVVLPVGKSKAGTTLYSTNPDLSSVIRSVLRHRERRMMARMLTACQLLMNLPVEELGKHGIDRERLNHLGKLIRPRLPFARSVSDRLPAGSFPS